MPHKITKMWTHGNQKTYVVDNIGNDLFSKQGRAARILSQPIGMRTNYLIATHPRSGTRWMSTLLVQHGLDFLHEFVGKDGIVSWQHIVPGKYKVKAKKVIHVVRNPLKTIASTAYVMDDHAFPFMFKYIGYPDAADKLGVSMYTWYHWNKLIEKRADVRLKFEDILANPLILFKEVNFNPSVVRQEIVHRKENAIEHPSFTWKDLKKRDKAMYNKILDLSVEYGY